MMRLGQATGPLVMDAAIAAIPLEHGATRCTTDRGFSRYPRLRLGKSAHHRLTRTVRATPVGSARSGPRTGAKTGPARCTPGAPFPAPHAWRAA